MNIAMKPLPISAYTVTSAVGAGRQSHIDALRGERSGLRQLDFDTNTLPCWLGEVVGFDVPLQGSLAPWDCRNHRLANFALQQDHFIDAINKCRERYGAARVGVFIGTSTSGVQSTEWAYRQRDPQTQRLPEWFDYQHTHNIYSTAEFVAQRLGLSGPCMAISTACSSSAKVFAAANRSIAMGACDAAVVGGIDSLCLTTLYGFNSLQLLSAQPCKPADVARCGISIGEAAGFAVLDRQASSSLALLGYGETSDAYHMSSPDPEGKGAASAMQLALARAQLNASDIDYVNLHGTGTVANDLSESKAICTVFGEATACSSTKGWTGHTLGAAGIVEAAIALLCIEHGYLPRSLNTQVKDPAITANVLMQSRQQPVRRVLSNSFGFGGNNCSLLFGGGGE